MFYILQTLFNFFNLLKTRARKIAEEIKIIIGINQDDFPSSSIIEKL